MTPEIQQSLRLRLIFFGASYLLLAAAIILLFVGIWTETNRRADADRVEARKNSRENCEAINEGHAADRFLLEELVALFSPLTPEEQAAADRVRERTEPLDCR